MPIFVLSVSAGVSFGGAFSLRVSLSKEDPKEICKSRDTLFSAEVIRSFFPYNVLVSEMELDGSKERFLMYLKLVELKLGFWKTLWAPSGCRCIALEMTQRGRSPDKILNFYSPRDPSFAYLSFFSNIQNDKRESRWSKLCNSLGRDRCCMLTFQALACIEGSWVQTGGSIWNNATATLTTSTWPGAMLNQSCDPPQLRGNAQLWKLNDKQNKGKLRAPKKSNSLLTNELLSVTRAFDQN